MIARTATVTATAAASAPTGAPVEIFARLSDQYPRTVAAFREMLEGATALAAVARLDERFAVAVGGKGARMRWYGRIRCPRQTRRTM